MASVENLTNDEQVEAQRLLDEKFKAEPEMATGTLAEEDIEKNVPYKEWHFSAHYQVLINQQMVDQHFERVYVQKPLSYLAMMEFTGLIGKKLDEAMSGPEGFSIDSLTPGDGVPLSFVDGQLTLAKSDFSGADSIIRGMAKIASYAPDFIAEAQCIWLRVPRQERALIMDIWAKPVDEGGLPVKDGREIQTLFIEQNYEELESFFGEWWSETRRAVEKAKARINRKGG